MATKRKAPVKIAQPVVKQNAKQALNANINEADTAVSGLAGANGEAGDVIEISSDPDSSEYELSDNEQNNSKDAAKASKSRKTEDAEATNGDADIEMPLLNGPADDAESDQEIASPTFGDLVRANETIDVPSALSAARSSALTAPGKSIIPPSSASLGTVLSQALRTDDADLFESCLHTTDLTTIRNTIQRLDSSLAGSLLTKLASRMHRRPGRAGSLMTWVQWTLVAHGGALATQPALVKQLGELNRVLEERSRGLSSLLALKGKLDMLEAQMQFRRSVQLGADSDNSDAEDEEGVVYVEGEESDVDVDAEDVDMDDDLAGANGLLDDEASENDDEYSEDDDEDAEAIGAEEPLDENEVDHDDIDSLGEDEDSEVEAAPPAKKGRR